MFARTRTVAVTGWACLAPVRVACSAGSVTGELKKWHKVTITFDGSVPSVHGPGERALGHPPWDAGMPAGIGWC